MIHHVYANRSNIGDWLSARGIQMLMGDVPMVEHLCDAPFVRETVAALQNASAEDLVLVGGGGLFMDYFEPFWVGLLERVHAPGLCLWGLGHCDLKLQRSRLRAELLQQVVRRSDLCVVRDDMTRSHLAIPDLPAPVACPSLCAIDPAPLGWGVLHVDNYTTVGAAAYQAMDEVCRAHAESTKRPYRKTNNRIDPDASNQLTEHLRRYADSDLVVSSALHGCIIAVAMGRPVLAVSGDRKIEGFMQAAGLDAWVLDTTEVARLPLLLRQIQNQPAVPEYTQRMREENRGVARAVTWLSSRRSRSSYGAIS